MLKRVNIMECFLSMLILILYACVTFFQKARLARIRMAKNASGNAFLNSKKKLEERMLARESGLELEDDYKDEDLFELQHHHLLTCLEKTTVSKGFRPSQVQTVKGSGCQGFMLSGIQAIRDSDCQGFRLSGVQAVKVSGCQGFRMVRILSGIQAVRGLGCQGFRLSRVQAVRGSGCQNPLRDSGCQGFRLLGIHAVRVSGCQGFML